MTIRDCSPWSWMFMTILAQFKILCNWIGLPSITSACFVSFVFYKGIIWLQAKSWSMNAMSVNPQWMSASVVISLLFMVNVHVINKCFLSMYSSINTTLRTDNRKTPKQLGAFGPQPLLSTTAPCCLGWLYLFPIASNLSWSLLH
jgi:hypothetical protein